MIDDLTFNGVGGEEGYGELAAGPLPLVRVEDRPLGLVTGGSLTRGLEVRLTPETPVESIAVGRYVTIEGEQHRFFGMITDVELRSAIGELAASPPEDAFTRAVLHGTAMFAVLKVSLMLRVDRLAATAPEPVKTVPAHFASVRNASQAEIEQIFGAEDDDHFAVGTPLDMDVTVCLDYGRFIERSNGVFGKTGTGKTFLTRMILLDILQKSSAQRERSKQCVNLVFDMHNDYGWEGQSEGPSRRAPGLKQIAGSSVLLMTLDEENARRRRAPIDATVIIAYSDIEAADLDVLRETLQLTPLAVDACYALEHRYRSDWFAKARAIASGDGGDDVLEQLHIHQSTLPNLRRALEAISRNAFVQPKTSSDTPRTILNHLLGGRSVVLEFGRYGNQISSYMLVANILTRRIYNEFRNRTEAAVNSEDQPNHLVITIEEAHKFLSPAIANQTIFGEIAREMRKYNVTLMIVDQRPSAIDEEVLSQIGTRLVCLLDNERDVDAVLAGVSGRSELRSVLAKLDSRQQALILGHGVPMPVVVRLPDYAEKSRGYSQFRESLGAPPARASDLLYND